MTYNRRGFLAGTAALSLATAARAASPMGRASGPVQANWPSLVDNYRYPDWFRDAKLGLWSHWGPQAVPEQGDWYGRFMYMQGHPMYEHHLKSYGHPSVAGMKDLQHAWKAERWDPQALMDRYVRAGAKYFVALATHHDNLDCYDSRYHAWNSLRVGPKRDIVGEWEKIARAAGLKFGVSNHAAHAWHWYQPAYGYDPIGAKKGVRYDAFTQAKADGKGQWWEGLDPQELYTGGHAVLPDGIDTIEAMNAWHDKNNGRWVETGPKDDPAYVTRWLLRQTDLVEKYKPDLVYFDDYGLPFGPVGLEAAADYYNRSIQWHGKIDVVLTGKQLKPNERFGIVQDVEKGFTDHLWDEPWQTDTCLGDWFYNVARLNDRSYKTAEEVIQRLADVVSKNGNLLLSVPQPGDGSIDSEEEKILDGMAAWVATNGEAIFGSRPWRIYGEGPTKLAVGMQNEATAKPFTPRDIRFTTNRSALYALFLAPPRGPATIASLGTGRTAGEIERVSLLGGGTLKHRRDAAGLHLDLPAYTGFVPAVRIEGRGLV
ncbi:MULTISPECIES: alpha-L-fucosidase [unclassified Sphingomonas]|uniref:alpha-L-fucosidase n=1 Tax=unclassified Sphingomonas TaxID=196159 RepID=UPI0017851715|nr:MULTISPECIES: alpha-L-fucosidase [unclassified Sphingomonas]MBD8641554.1 alpha-L-fucosidase [Sphingomonas sp. CFBP 13733]MBD8702048.1 alpha-L-fucosidase [Sphingomonas sp. CFBP 13714]